MSKNQHDYYYSFTSPPVPEVTSSKPDPSPSAPCTDTVIPPSYDDVFSPSGSTTNRSMPPPNKSNFEGYILDTSDPLANSNASTVLHMPMPTPETFQNNPCEYGQLNPTIEANVPLLSNNDEEEESFQGRPPPPGYSLYRAKYKIVRNGIISRDKHINEDGEALLQFLYQHNKPPRMTVHFYGYHEETTWTSQTTRNNEGELVEERVPTTRRVDDFEFEIDCSSDISPICQGIYILPNSKTKEQPTLRQLCNQYVHSKRSLKELKLTKEVNWDYNGLTRALTNAIRNSGFYENVEITYKMEDHEIIVKTNSRISRWSDNVYLKGFLFITCLWIVVFPIIWLCKKRFGHSYLKSAWKMKISERNWYEAHVQEVINSCRGNYKPFKRFFQSGTTVTPFSANMTI
ncbi:uncharacterized protein BX663DRAFT_533361 [Cokeromyces recurvatus]|uniref:uncharacterized protein n=1 Tax=Cokeromyces recurvatus TaxID=90255 RepID=UPI00221E6E2F|nr:uncharacterized protein BX663DRAFT_533361 [Cokeromyces recurvatus]KAI7898367.1 hypothetical protein BX663DRAFT_533361 [Cokeromyces recurvatus]